MSVLDEAKHSMPPFEVTAAFAGTVVYGPGGTFGPRLQPDLQLVLVHTGSMTVTIDGASHSVPAGHTALLKPGHMEHFAFATTRETWHRWIAVSTLPLLPEAAARFEALPLSVRLSEAMSAIADVLSGLQQTGAAREDELIRSLGRAATLLFLDEVRRTDADTAKHPAVLVAKAAIHARCAERIGLSDLARAAGMSPEHLIRLFRKDEGVTPIQYLWRYRVNQGVSLLRSTGLSVGEVAAQCGFQTSYHFARMVKQLTGQTPSELRRGG
jgi:AraC-like DNA-binding protein/quercetin dioxygenase-like cupin family protein